jgi:zinc transport system substrate-binding protein
MKRWVRYILIILLIGLISAGVYFLLQRQANPIDRSKIQVTTSFYPLYFFASEIGGDKVEVRNITPVGAEPHDYEPSAQEIAAIEDSQMLVLNGGVEAWGDRIKDQLDAKKTLVIIAGEGLFATNSDPHIWLDPVLAKKEAARILQGFIQIDLKNKVYYEANAQALNVKLDQLNSEYKNSLQNCNNKNIVTSHAAFGYLASEYGLKQIPIAGMSPDAEPSIQSLTQVADFVKANKIKYIFFETLVSPKFAQTIAQETGAQTLVLDPLEGLSVQDMQSGINYVSVMESNLKNLKIALECGQ